MELDKYNFAKIFNIVEKNKNSYYNICNTIRFINIDDITPNNYSNYIISSVDSWTAISYKFYKTIKLWWLICKFNDIKNPFTELIPGKYIKIPDENLVKTILNEMIIK